MTTLMHLAEAVLAYAPDPTPTAPFMGPAVPPAPKTFTGSGVMKLLLIMLQIGGAALGVILVFRSKKGDLSATMSSGAVFLFGLFIFVGSGTFAILSMTTGLLDFLN